MVREKILHLRMAFSLVWKSASRWTAIYAVFTLMQSILPLTILYLIKLIIDDVSNAISAANKPEATHDLITIIVITGIVYFIQAILNSYTALVKEHQNKEVNAYVNDLIHSKSTSLELGFFENPKYQDLFHRALQESSYRPVKIVNGVFQLTQSMLSIILLSILLITLHWGVAAVLIIASLPEFFIRLHYARKTFDFQQQHSQDERKLNYFHRILTIEAFAKEIRIFSLGKLFMNKFQELFVFLRKKRISIVRNKAIIETFAHILTVLAVFSAFGFISLQTIEGSLTIGTMVMYFMAFQKGMAYLKDMLNNISGLYEDNLFITNFNEFLNLQPSTVSNDQKICFPSPLKKGIELENVSFSYPDSKRKALDNIKLLIPAGKTIAIVGENGSGKSTLVKLICGLYKPCGGKILFDDIAADKFEETAYRSNISVVFQDFVLFNMTARENIWFGNVNAPVDDKSIQKAAEDSGIDTVLNGLPQGYDTMLGKLFSNSEELSIGEWQKIALAKAFYRDSQIIILDEPTSSLDAKTEYELYHNFRKIIKDKTAIIISHRYSTVRMADHIVVLDKNSIAEQGTHEELLKHDGIYARAYKMQTEQ